MNTGLAVTMVLMGLAGTAHCAAMCGAACGALSRSRTAGVSRHGMLAFQLGRLLSYSLAGALVATGVSWLATWGSLAPALRPVWAMLHVAAIALGLWLLVRGRQPAWIESFGERVTQQVSPSQPVLWMQPGAARAAAAGSLWVAWPCGLLQSALVVSALGSNAMDGAVLMSLFAAASGLGLWLGPALWMKLAGRGAGRAQSMAVRLAGLTLAGASGWALVKGVSMALGSDFCL
jgi:sulfite exporter TauE/SafE